MKMVSFILLLFVISSANAQKITVREIPSLNKLPVNAIDRIFQDSEGYMWYGTINGLCRYDGYNILTFRADFNHPNLLKNNHITTINEDHNNKIWFGTDKGAYTIDKANWKITPVDLGKSSEDWIFSIHVTKNGEVWLSVPGTFFCLNPNGKIIGTYNFNIENWKGAVYFVFEDKNGDLIVSITGGGMYRFNKTKDAFEPYFHHSDYLDVESIVWDDTHKCYWLGTWGKGIVRFNPNEKDPDKQYTPQALPVDVSGESVADIFNMVQDDDLKYLWVTTIKNLFAFRITEKVTLEQVDTSPFLNPDNKMLYEIYKDQYGKMWVAAFDVKSFIVDIHEQLVENYPLIGLRDRINANPAIITLYRDKEGIFWFSQERYSLCLYNSKTNQLKHYTECEETNKLPLSGVTQIIGSRDAKHVWISNYFSPVLELYREGMEIKVGRRIYLNTETNEPQVITTIFEDERNNLWIGSLNGLYVYHLKDDKLEIVSESLKNITSITQTGDGKIWVIMSTRRICSIDAKMRVEQYPYVKNYSCCDVTSDGKLWLGTEKGEVFLFDPATKEFKDFSLQCGLNGDIINNITVDQYNHVWITTNQSIKEYDPGNGAYRIYRTLNPDFLLSRILPNSVFYDNNEAIYFGGISGIVSIQPSQRLEGIPENVKTHITDIKIEDHSIWDDSLKERLTDHTIYLHPNDRNLEIHFSSLDFHHLDQVRYSYQLDGVDKDWMYAREGVNSAFYNQLHKGTYTFKVKATDKNGLWSNKITELEIVQLPNWYESLWALSIYIILIVFGLGYGIYKYLKRMEHRNSEKWADSAELVKMHRYIENDNTDLSPEFAHIDALLMDKVKTIIKSNLGEDKFSVETLAEALNMSRSTLSRKIKLITGKTPFDLIKEIKMQHARDLLENKTVTVTEVMTALGYNDLKNFSSSFKSTFGISPSEYQKQYRQK